MKYCQECGKPSSEDAVFCTHCGETFSTAEKVKQQPIQEERTNEVEQQEKRVVEPPSEAVSAQASKPVVKQPMKKTSKVLWSVISVLLVVLIGTHLYFQSIYDPMKRISAMNAAYNNQEKETFLEHFHLIDGTVADADNFYTLVSQYGWSELRNDLTYEIEKIKNKQHADMIYHRGEFISITNEPVFLGLYENVRFTLIPTVVSVEPPLSNMTLQFGSKEVEITKAEELVEIGKFIPGEYDWSYEATDGLIPLAGKGTYIVEPGEANKREITLDWDLTTIYVESDVADAILYIDGKSTKKKVSELAEIYPAKVNDKVKVYAVTKDQEGKEIKSEEVTLDSDDIYIPFEHVQKEQDVARAKEDIERFYKDFREDYEEAIYYANFDYIANYFKSGSEIRSDFAKFVTDHSTIPGYHYTFLLNEITSVKELSSNKYQLLSFEKFNYSSYDDDPLRYDRKKEYIISEENGTFYMDSIKNLETKKTKY